MEQKKDSLAKSVMAIAKVAIASTPFSMVSVPVAKLTTITVANVTTITAAPGVLGWLGFTTTTTMVLTTTTTTVITVSGAGLVFAGGLLAYGAYKMLRALGENN